MCTTKISKYFLENSRNVTNCEINLILTWSEDCILISGSTDNQVPKFAITDTKLYVPVVTLSTQGNVKLLDQLKSGFKITIKVSTQTQNQYLDYLIDPSFQGVKQTFCFIVRK